ncbi:hypothetical protein ABK040_012110 [Willaertia magna]
MIFNNNNKYATIILFFISLLLLNYSTTTTLAKEQQQQLKQQPLLASIQYIANIEQQEQQETTTTGQHFCYGSIIHNKFILTAAHCNIQIPLEHLEIVITMNNNNENNNNNNKKIMKRKVKQFISHELYNSQLIKNDIALIELNEELPLSIFNNNNYNNYNYNNNFIMKLESMINIPFDVSLFTTTTGTTENNKKKSSDSEITIVPNEECNVIDLEMSSPQQLCAKLNNKIENDLMMGESGSPIYYMEEKSGQLVQVGITSYGSNNYLNNNKSSVLGVYTNVANYLNWIKKHIHNNNSDYNNNNSQQLLMIKEYNNNFNLERNVRPEPIPLMAIMERDDNLKLRGKLNYNNVIIERMVNKKKKKIIKFEKNNNNNDDNNNMNNKIATNNAMKGSVSSSSMWWMVVITLISTIIAMII